jgi:hypothetical protein
MGVRVGRDEVTLVASEPQHLCAANELRQLRTGGAI